MDCHDVTNRFSDLRDGRLGGQGLAELEEHLGTCLACRQEWAEFQKAIDALRGMGAVEPGPGFAARVQAAIETPPWHRRLGRWLFVPWRIKLPLEAAALVVLAIGTVFIYHRTPEMRQVVEQPVLHQAPSPTESERRDTVRVEGTVAREEQGANAQRPVPPPIAQIPKLRAGEPAPKANAESQRSIGAAPSEQASPERTLPSPPSPPTSTMPRALGKLNEPPSVLSQQEGRPAERLGSGVSRESVAQAPAQAAPTPFRIMTLRTPDVQAAAERVRAWVLQAGGRLEETPVTSESTPSGQRTLSLIIPPQAVPRLDAFLAELGLVFGKELTAPASNEALVSLTISPKPSPPSPDVQ